MTVTDRVGSSPLRFEVDITDTGDRSRGGRPRFPVLGIARTAVARVRQSVSDWRGQRLVYRWFAAGLDLVLVWLFATVVVIEHSWQVGIVPVALALLFVVAVGVSHGYDTRRAASGLDEFRAIGRGVLVLAATVLAVDFVGLVDLQVLPTVLGLAAIGICVCLVRLSERSLARWLRSQGYFTRRTLVLGSASQIVSVTRDLAGSGRHGLDLVGVCLPERESADIAEIGQLRVWGSVSEAAELIADRDIDAVIVSSDAMGADELRQLRWAIEHTHTEVLIAPHINEVLADRVALRAVSATPLLTVSSGPTRPQLVVKNVMDRTLSFLLLVLAAPIIAAGAIAVRMTSPGEAIFRQVRIGVDGAPFTMLKLRSMVADAEVRKADLADVGNKADGAQFKMVADPRITPVGAVLRRFSIDELPQLWNVLRGDMSLVGPRPPLPSEVATYDAMAVHRLHVKPGVTGLWQVSGRSDLSWEESVRLDLRYVDNFSLLRDLQILWRTGRAVLGARGAY